MKNIRCAIVDNGVSSSGYKVLTGKDIEAYTIRQGNVVPATVDERKISHGTVCAAILAEFTSKCILYSLDVRDEDSETIMVDTIVSALYWCIEQKINIVCMSIGTMSSEELSELIKPLDVMNMQGIVTIAACCNENIISYPASLPQVLGVRQEINSELKPGEFQCFNNPLDGIEITVSLPEMKTLNKLEEDFFISLLPSNSVAVPFIAAKLCNYMCDEQSMPETYYQLLAEESIKSRVLDFTYYQNNIKSFANSNAIPVPIIGIEVEENEKDNIKKFGIGIQLLFLDEGFHCVVVGSCLKKNLLLKRFGRKPDEFVSYEEYVTIIYNLSRPDVLILYIDNNEIKRETKLLDTLDMMIVSDKEEALFNQIDLDSIVYYKCNFSFRTQLSKVYQYIKEQF